MRKVEQLWMGYGKMECLEAIRQANSWIHSKRPDKFYDYRFATRSMHFGLMGHDMVHWYNRNDCKLYDFIDKLYDQIKNMDEQDSYYLSVSFMRGSWF